MFEPFHPTQVPALDFLIEHRYIRPHMLDKKTKEIAAAIFDGTFTDNWVDSQARSFVHSGLLIKDIAANLFCFAMAREFPHIKPVLLIRNPFAVALSKFKTKIWNWPSEPLDLLQQKDLLKDYLLPHEDIIKKTSAKNNYVLNLILLWSIINYIPLRQFKPEDVHVCFYEDIYTAPSREIARIMHFAQRKQKIDHINLPADIIKKPSFVSGQQTNIVLGTSPITSWKTELDPKLIKDGFAILDHFGLADLYDGNGIPCPQALKKLQKKVP